MKNIILKFCLIVAIALVAGYNVYSARKSNVMSDLVLANVEALANSRESSSDRFLIVNRNEITKVDERGNQYTVIVLDCQDIHPAGYECA